MLNCVKLRFIFVFSGLILDDNNNDVESEPMEEPWFSGEPAEEDMSPFTMSEGNNQCD